MKVGIWITVGVLLVLGFITFMSSFRITKAHEFCYKYDLRTGEIIVPLDIDGNYKTGWIWKTPFIQKVNIIDLRPKQVCIGSQNTRVLNCKLVQFDPKGLDQFIEWHGRDDYYYSSLGSSESNYKTEFTEIMETYAYDSDPGDYPFLKILKELN